MHAFSHVICICIRVAAEVEEIVYEVVAEPQGQAPVPVHELLNLIRKLRPDGKMMTMFRDGSMTGFLGVLALSVSIKDRSLWQC